MIRTSQVHHCRACGSTHIVKNGRNRSGNQQYQCRACGASKVLLPKQRYSEERKAEVLRAYQERSSLRGLSPPSGSRAKRSRSG
jgi:transposase-like protein